ncbi:hypothetical protein CVT24_011349 [Panaeolus cyanescens]|uniref:Mid2 domain-containing protein n=1 Tax=Panaeolus cyanescens TaxID=181874 RepID=A0A409YGH5_9AGAR|nr:hypothetical protein CVT24_011349 [Panaeolus cyanescens]
MLSTNVSTSGASASRSPTNTLNTPARDRKESNIGAIVGGVIGGLLIVGIVVAVIVYMVVRSRRKPPPHDPALFKLSPPSSNPPVAPTSPAISSLAHGVMSSPLLSAPGATALHNLNDPSTIPITGFSPPRSIPSSTTAVGAAPLPDTSLYPPMMATHPVAWPGVPNASTMSRPDGAALPITLPSNSTVPPWAWADVVSQGAFDIAIAQTITTTPAPGPTPTSSDTSSNTSTSRSSPSSTNTSSSSDGGGKSTSVGAIVGSVIGGLIIIGLVVVLVVWLLLRSKRKAAAAVATGIPSSPPMSGTGYVVTAFPPVNPASTGGIGMPKLYNPDDPSTFPMMMDQSSPGLKGSPATTMLSTTASTPPMSTVPPSISPQSSPAMSGIQSPMKLTPNRKITEP